MLRCESAPGLKDGEGRCWAQPQRIWPGFAAEALAGGGALGGRCAGGADPFSARSIRISLVPVDRACPVPSLSWWSPSGQSAWGALGSRFAWLSDEWF